MFIHFLLPTYQFVFMRGELVRVGYQWSVVGKSFQKFPIKKWNFYLPISHFPLTHLLLTHLSIYYKSRFSSLYIFTSGKRVLQMEVKMPSAYPTIFSPYRLSKTLQSLFPQEGERLLRTNRSTLSRLWMNLLENISSLLLSRLFVFC